MVKGLDKNYWRYWIASAASQSASNVLQYVVSLYVLEITGSATLFASMLSIIIFPRLALTPISGVIAAFLYENLSLSWAFGVVCILNFMAFLLQRRIQPKYEVKQEREKKKSSYMADFREGIKVIQNDGFLRNFMKVLPVVNAFFGATFSVSIMYLLREVYGLSAYMYGLYCTITASMSMVSPLIVAPLVKKYPASKVFATVTMLIAIEIAGIGVFAFCGVSGLMPVLVSVIGITFLDCLTILAAIPMQMSGSILLQTTVLNPNSSFNTSVIKMFNKEQGDLFWN